MLTRIETLYLGILRVVILVIATLALLAAIVGLASSGPAIGRMLGFSKEPPRGGTLGEFIAEKKATVASTADLPQTDAPTAPAAAADQRVTQAARMVANYMGGSIKGDDVRQAMTKDEDGLPYDQLSAFRDSELHLAQQLRDSKGKKLSGEQVGELFGFHRAHFIQDAEVKVAERASDAGRAYLALSAAGGSFFVFILIAFAFLFVKIERSLRVVRTHEVGETADA